MKRILFFFLLLTLPLQVFCQTKNLIYSQNFKTEEFSIIQADLTSENISASIYNGQEILIEVSSNNKNLLPEIIIAEQRLEICGTKNKLLKGDNCTVFLYIPYDFLPESFSFNTNSGSITLENLVAIEDIYIKTVSGTITLKNLTSESLTVYAEQTNCKITQLTCSYFTVASQKGSAEINLKKAPLASSSCRLRAGPVTLSVSRTELFQIEACSRNSIFINNFTKTKQSAATTRTYKTADDAVVILLETDTGDITITP